MLNVMGADGLPRNTRVRVKLGTVDDISLDIGGTVVERLDALATTAPDASDDTESDDLEDLGGPIAIAVDVADADAPSQASAATEA